MINEYIQGMGSSTIIAIGTATVSLLGFKFEYEKAEPRGNNIVENLFIAAFIISTAFIAGSIIGLGMAIIRQFL